MNLQEEFDICKNASKTMPDHYYPEELAEALVSDPNIMPVVALATINDPDFALFVIKSKRLREYEPPDQEFTLAHFAVFKHEKAAIKAVEDPQIYEIRTTTGETVAHTAANSHKNVAQMVKSDHRIRDLITKDGSRFGNILDRL